MTQLPEKIPQNLYDRDFLLWTEKTANLLKAGKLSEIDIANLIEEIESMGRSEKRELKNHLIVLLMHLLKWKYQPGKRSESWKNTINEQRISLELLLEDSPSIKPLLPEVFDKSYQRSRLTAAKETGIKIEIFPETSPFTFVETLDFEYLPD
ncbi:MAG: DUF29 domain-containing protein [Microcoleaceae cyanobacterium MO_207.B10]|nr:DUF29 domain-containing protein [Microcoleaceae cyanobacterium MO_207.B10]